MQLHHLFPKQKMTDEYAVGHTAYLISVFIWQETLQKNTQMDNVMVNTEGKH